MSYLIPIACAVVAGILGWLGSRIDSTVDGMAETETTRCGTLFGRPPGTVCEIKGVVKAGPNGPIKAELSGKDCVWYRLTVEEHWTEHKTFPGNAPGPDGDGYIEHNRKTMISDKASTEPIVVTDGTGEVLVDLAGKRVSHAEPSYVANEAALPHQTGGPLTTHDLPNIDGRSLLKTEYLVAPGQKVYVLGVIGDSTDADRRLLTLNGRADLQVSAKTEEEMTSTARYRAMACYIGAIAFVLIAGYALARTLNLL